MTSTGLYLPVQGLTVATLLPEVALLGYNSEQIQDYAGSNGLVLLGSPDINRVAQAVKSVRPDRDFISYAMDNYNLPERDVIDAYNRLHEDIWKRYLVRAKELLRWQTSQLGVAASLLRDYNIRNRQVTVNLSNPVNWLQQNGRITEEMADLLGASINTYVWSDPNPDYADGYRALVWVFRFREWPYLSSDWGPWFRLSGRGFLLGR